MGCNSINPCSFTPVPGTGTPTETKLYNKCSGFNVIGSLGLSYENCKDQEYIFESINSSDESNNNDASEHECNDSDMYVNDLLENYTTIEGTIKERDIYGVVKERVHVKATYVPKNRIYYRKLIMSKHHSQLRGKLLGCPTRNIASNQTFFTNPVIDDVAICNSCTNYGLWGDACTKCNQLDATFLKVIAECVLCSQRGELGHKNTSCVNPKKKPRTIPPIYASQVRAHHHPAYLRPVKVNTDEVVLNTTFIIPDVMMYNREKRTVGQIYRTSERMKIITDKFHEAAALNATTTLTSAQLKDGDYCIADSGATTHLTFDERAMKNLKSLNVQVVMGNGSSAKNTKTGDISGLLMVNEGKKAVRATLQDAAYAKDAKYNLFNLTYMIKKGWKMSGDNDSITLRQGTNELKFTTKIKTRNASCL